MMNSINLLGHVGKDSELRYTKDGTAIMDFSLATKSGKDKKEVTWFKCSMFGSRAEKLNQYVLKGTPLFVSGPVKLNQWIGKDGKPFAQIEVLASELSFVGSKAENENQKPNNVNYYTDAEIPF